MMRKAQICFNCFKYGHISVGCLAKSACEIKDAGEDIIPFFTHRLHKKQSKFETESLIKEFRLTAVQEWCARE